MNSQVFGQGIKVAETDKLNIDSIIARLLEGKNSTLWNFTHFFVKMRVDAFSFVYILNITREICRILAENEF